MDLPILLITLGALFLTGLLADRIGERTHLPRVTLLLACGLLAGRAGFGLIPSEVEALYDFLSVTALTMVAFLLGSSLTAGSLRRHGGEILAVSAAIVVTTMALVAAGLWLLGVPAPVALLMGAIATATDPAATRDAIRQSGARGAFVDLVRGIVAVDDAWGLLAFAFAAVFAKGLGGEVSAGLLGDAGWEIGGALVLGAAIGLPASYLTGRLSPGEPLQSEALGIVFLTAGVAMWADVSFLLAGMTAGMIIANLARHHDRAFNEIEHIQWPFMILFFILAGASLEPDALAEAGVIGLGFILLRIVSRIGGGWIGGALAGSPAVHRPWYGAALLPQAGVAVGMALVAKQEFPQHADMILTLTIGTTVVFELIGPVTALLVFRRLREHGK